MRHLSAHEHPKWLGEVEKSMLSNPDLTLILVSYHLPAEWKRQFDQVYDLAPVRVALAHEPTHKIHGNWR